MAAMSIHDFVAWAGTQKRAAKMIGISPASMNRIIKGTQQITRSVAERVEAVSDGKFSKCDVMWPRRSKR